MNSLRLLYFYLFLGIFIACQKTEEVYPIEPHIDFGKIEFIDLPNDINNQPVADSIKLSFSFTDGDADFGVNELYLKAPYNAFSYFKKINGEIVPLENFEDDLPIKREDLIRYSDRFTPPFDTLPPYETTSPCINWKIINDKQSFQPIDTIYFQINPNHYNVTVAFYVRQLDGSYNLFDFRRELCTTYDGRVQAINQNSLFIPFVVKMHSIHRGDITYKMHGNGFKYFFGGKSIKLKFYITDRAFHRSNILETDLAIPPI